MNSDKILQSNLLDIVFEHRNKDYGAYPLRKFYNNRLYKSLGVVFMLALVLCLLSFLQPHAKTLITSVPYEGPIMSPPPADKPVPPKTETPKPAAAPLPVHNTDAYTPPLIVPDHNVTHTITTLTDTAGIGIRNEKGRGPVVVAPPTPSVIGTPEPPTPVVPPVDIYTPSPVAEIMPSYPGGPDAMRKFLEKNLTNPQDLDAGQSISVQIKFVVGYDGKLKGFETVQDGGAAFNNEVLRVLKKMPQWIPGKTRGQNVSVYYVLPVKFISTE